MFMMLLLHFIGKRRVSDAYSSLMTISLLRMQKSLFCFDNDATYRFCQYGSCVLKLNGNSNKQSKKTLDRAEHLVRHVKLTNIALKQN